jgi:hypothetical protein
MPLMQQDENTESWLDRVAAVAALIEMNRGRYRSRTAFTGTTSLHPESTSSRTSSGCLFVPGSALT